MHARAARRETRPPRLGVVRMRRGQLRAKVAQAAHAPARLDVRVPLLAVLVPADALRARAVSWCDISP